MENETFAVKLAETDSRARSNTRRIEKLEKDNEALNRMATSIEVLASEQKHQTETILELKTDMAGLDTKVGAIEAKPGKRWEAIVDKAIWAVVGGVIVFLMAQIGMS